MIKIGIDGRLLQGKLTGVGKYVSNLINYITDQDDTIYFSVYSNREIECRFKSNKVQVLLDKGVACKVKPMVWSKMLSARIINRDKPDVFLAGDALLPLFLKAKKVISVVHDLNATIAPETMSRLRLITDKLFFKRDIHKADYIISNSFGTAAKLKKYYHVETDVVIHPIIDEWYRVLDSNSVSAKLKELNINYPYLLTVATREPRKNLDKTIEAFIALKKGGNLPDYKLLLIGSKGWKYAKVDELLALYPEDIVQFGYTPDELMPYLYNGAELFVFPSSYEGFGMPAREAMYCGIPVVTSNIPELREATYGKAAYINPDDLKTFENAIKSILMKKMPKNASARRSLGHNDQLEKLMPVIYN